jgi:hypothetical protein
MHEVGDVPGDTPQPDAGFAKAMVKIVQVGRLLDKARSATCLPIGLCIPLQSCGPA